SISKRVVLPEPFGPTRATRSRGPTRRSVPVKRSWGPKAFQRLVTVITKASVGEAGSDSCRSNNCQASIFAWPGTDWKEGNRPATLVPDLARHQKQAGGVMAEASGFSPDKG